MIMFQVEESLAEYKYINENTQPAHPAAPLTPPCTSPVPPVPYHVVKTNYRHFACVYSCYELFSLMFEVFSVLSRGPEINDADLATCHRAFDALELDITRLAPVQQTGECDAEDIQGSGECCCTEKGKGKTAGQGTGVSERSELERDVMTEMIGS